MNKTKNLVFALILTSAILLAANVSILNVNAQTQVATYIYSSIGGSISANGAAQTGANLFNSNVNENANFSATAQSGYKFLAWEYVLASGACTVTDNPTSINITAAGGLQALFIPTTNTTAPPTGTGAATVLVYDSIGGTTNPGVPTGTTPPATYTNYTIGTTYDFTATPGVNTTTGTPLFKFLYWIVATSTANYYTTSTLSYNITETPVVLQAMFIPTDSSVTLPGTPTPTPVPEFSSIATVAIAAALVAVALGTYTYTKKTKK